jgi:ankyrin repeat protein
MTKEQMLTLINSIEIGAILCAQELIEKDLKILTTPLIDKNGLEALIIHYASMFGRLNIVQFVLEKKPELLNVMAMFEHTPLRFAAARGHVNVVEYLLSLGADHTIGTYSPDSLIHGYLPIHWAAARGHHEVVQVLMNHGVSIDSRVGKKKLHLIHIASLQGFLEVIKVLLVQNPSLLNEIDALNQTPVLWAASKGHYHVVHYFISLQANIDLATHRPYHENHGLTPLMWASKNGCYEAANALILKKIETEAKELFIPLIRTAAQALDLMALEPAFINSLLSDRKIYNLIRKSNCRITDDAIYWYKPAGRRPSLFVEFNTKTETSIVFKPVKELGEGAYGIVRLFQATEGQEIAVKSPRSPIINTPWFCRSQLGLATRKEAEFNQIAYPNDPLSEIFNFETTQNKQSIYTNRFVMSYVKGEKAILLIPKIKSVQELATITLKIAQELDRIHQVGIIHGDLHLANIMIDYDGHNNIVVRFIDFGLSLHRTESAARTWEKQIRSWIPPELCGKASSSIKPEPNQDIYSLGNTLKLIFEKHSCYQALMKSFPSIHSFITASQAIVPENRPTLSLFSQQLTNELQPKKRVLSVPFWNSVQNNSLSEKACLQAKPESTARCKRCALM